ncbi:hypothetical protein ACIQW5_20525 [Methylorubrum thiocyanatum]|uniref:hypothetical protein n=1 Tax=Methylorubrum thiocyanatum TaxID=47958 RepID=UPI00383A1A1A
MKPLTAPRAVYLQDGDAFAVQDLVFADESWTDFVVLRITILPGSEMSNVIGASDGTIVLSAPVRALGSAARPPTSDSPLMKLMFLVLVALFSVSTPALAQTAASSEIRSNGEIWLGNAAKFAKRGQ